MNQIALSINYIKVKYGTALTGLYNFGSIDTTSRKLLFWQQMTQAGRCHMMTWNFKAVLEWVNLEM